MFTRLNLEFLRRRAKDLLKSARVGDTDAIRRIRQAHPAFGRANSETIRGAVALHDAQLVLGREHGFSGWTQLKTYVEALAACGTPSSIERVQEAIRAGDADTVRALTTTEPHLLASRTAPLGWTPLHIAAAVGNVETLRILLDAGADINARDTDIAATPLHVAIGFGQADAGRLLVERGADISARNADGATILHEAAYGRDLELIRQLEKADVRLDIFAAVALGDAKVVRQLADQDPDVIRGRMPVYHKTTMTPLHLAAFHDSVKIIALLLELGADVASVDEQGRTPIDLALNAGKTSAYEQLKARGTVPNPAILALVESPARAERMARLHAALVEDDVEAVAQALDADPSLLNARLPDVWGSGGTYGAAPLHWAAYLGHIELARLLLRRGADLTVRDLTYNGTPLGWACESRRSNDLIALLKAHGAT
jgi:ankyrin repeat protein